jgi:prepilin-type N-terminal cleavage/methylation domain-containing protein
MDLRTQAEGLRTRGFTLMEVTVAILLLASALVILLGLQGSTIHRAVRDRHQQQAMLVARQILAAIEVNSDDLEQQDLTAPVDELLSKLLGMSGRVPGDEDEAPRYFQANLHVEDLELPVPSIDPKFAEQKLGLKQVVLTIFWGENVESQLRVVFLVPSKTEAAGVS